MNKHIALDEKLTALRAADPYRKWYSLDDRRVCVLCGKLISGRMIDVWEDKAGAYHLHCPTTGCAASPRDWFYHGATPVLAGKVTKSRAPIISFGLPASSLRAKRS
jgi:hypothetical protein